MDQLYSIDKDYGPVEIREKGSRFIAFGFPLSSPDEVKKKLNHLKKHFFDASHFCFAYRLIDPENSLSNPKMTFRYNDDGEPGGTAGLPIYNEILSKNYVNILVVVVRYFGGIKLGTGRLSRSYAAVARRVLENVKKIEYFMKTKMTAFFPFELTGDMMQLIKRYAVEMLDQDFTPEGVRMSLSIPMSIRDEFAHAVRDAGRGKIDLISL